MSSTRTPKLSSTTVDSPVGSLRLVVDETSLIAILWPCERHRRVVFAGEPIVTPNHPVLDATRRQLDEYFDGARRHFELPLDPRGTEFQREVWWALAEIPYGETSTYAKQAASIGRPSAVRAVGSANGRNPLSIVLPCHRVVGTDGGLTGFAGGLDAKRWLLDHEAGHAAR